MTVADRVRAITAVKVQPPATVVVQWSDGVRAAIDLSETIRGESFRSLRKASAFSLVRVGEWGHSIEWPSGPELSAEMVWLETLSATGHQDAHEFLEWRLRNALSLSQAAAALGLSRRMVAYYSNGEKPVPKPILLACKGWEAGQKAGAPRVPTATYRLFREAVLQRKQIAFTYRGKHREVCPIILGYKGEQEKCLTYQFKGGTSSDEKLPPGGEWRCFYLSEVRDARLRKGRWYEGNRHMRPQACVEVVDVDVNIAETLKEYA